MEHGVFISGQTEYVLHELYSGRIQQRDNDIMQYDRYVFASRLCSSPSDNEVVCGQCLAVRKQLRRLCRARFETGNKPMHKFTNTSSYVFASPSKAMVKIDMVKENLRSVQKSNVYLKSCLEKQREKHGISISMDKSVELFDVDADVEAKRILNSNGEHSAGKELLSRILWNQSVIATLDAKTKGKT